MNTEYSFSVDVTQGVAIGTHRNKQLLNCFSIVLVPLLLTMDVSMAGTKCDY